MDNKHKENEIRKYYFQLIASVVLCILSFFTLAKFLRTLPHPKTPAKIIETRQNNSNIKKNNQLYIKNDLTNHCDIILMEYSRMSLSEKVKLLKLNGNNIDTLKEFELSNIYPWDRNLRYLNSKGNLVYFESLKEAYMDEDWNLYKSPTMVKGKKVDFIEYIFSSDPYKETYRPTFVEKNLSSQKERRRIFKEYIFEVNYNASNVSVAIRTRPSYYQYYNEKYILNRCFGQLYIFEIYPNLKKREPYLYTALEKKDYPATNPILSNDGKNMVYSHIHLKIDSSLNDYIMGKKTPYKKDKKVRIIPKSGWLLYAANIKNNEKPRLLVKNYKIYDRTFRENKYPIPKKCFSPSCDKVLFTGALEKPGVANVYTVDIKTKKIETILNVNDKSGKFNPDLEWTKNGMLITATDSIYLKEEGKKIEKLNLPPELWDLRSARMSPDGKRIMFFGRNGSKFCLFILKRDKNSILQKELKVSDIVHLQGSWIYPGKVSTIKNWKDFETYEELEDC